MPHQRMNRKIGREFDYAKLVGYRFRIAIFTTPPHCDISGTGRDDVHNSCDMSQNISKRL